MQLGCKRWRPEPKVQLAVTLSLDSLVPLSTAWYPLAMATVNEDGVTATVALHSFVEQFTIGRSFRRLAVRFTKVQVSGERSVVVLAESSYCTLVPSSGTYVPVRNRWWCGTATRSSQFLA